ncbi:MAG: hypothetical protein KAI73_07655 [Rhodospirillaceae bacterium]|nr:hypothetical protein [Rhodospirillaceae bacterium]
MTLWLTILYSASGVATLAFFVPQIIRAWQSPEYALGQSTLAWWGWTATSVIATAYAALVVEDLPFTLVGVANIVGHVLVAIPASMARAR